jgi:hypothetical protein
MEELFDTISFSFTSFLIKHVKFQNFPDKKFYRIILSLLLISNEKLIFAYKQMKFHEYTLLAPMI